MAAITTGAVSAPAHSLNDWVEAHQTLMQEESALLALARRVASQESPLTTLEQQEARVAALQKKVEELYDQVMAELAHPRPA